MFGNNIKFICERELPVMFSSLVINVSSIEELYPGGYNAFCLNSNIYGITNGFLLIIFEMKSYPTYLFRIIDEVLLPNDFQKGSDFVIGSDKMFEHNSPVNGGSIDWCIEADWVRSFASSKSGNLVWHTSFDKDQRTTFSNIKYTERPWTQYWTFWYDKHPFLKNMRLKMRSPGIKTFLMEKHRYDVVDDKTFISEENDRLPLFLDTQFGISPRIQDVYSYDCKGYVAILEKSGLSDTVAGLMVYSIEDHKLTEKIVSVENQTGVNQEVDKLFRALVN